MTATNKALYIFVAATALVIGVVLNGANTQTIVNSNILLEAQLLKLPTNANEEVSASLKGDLRKLNLINFWASWCSPCRQEMPIFEAMANLHKAVGFQVIGIAIDSPEKTRSMLDSMGITYPIYYAEQTGMQLMDHLGNVDGFLPYSLLIDENGVVLEQTVGRVHEEDITAWVSRYLD